MTQKLFWLFVIWVGVVVSYIMLAVMMPAFNEIVVSTNTTLASGASGNMSNFPGTQEAVQTFPVYVWAIPGLCGIVFTAIMLVKR